MTPVDAKSDHPAPAAFEVTIRTPAGSPGQFDITREERISAVIDHAVRYFVEKHELADGPYNLVLVTPGGAKPLVVSDDVDDYPIDDESDLRLVPAGPQVDGVDASPRRSR